MKTVLYGPVVLTGFFLLLFCPPPRLVFISPSSRLWSGWHVAGGGGKDGSSAQRKSLPLEKPVSDARPHGPLTCRLCDLWRLGASGHCRLFSSLLQNCKEPHTLHHHLREYTKRNSSHMLSCSAGTYTHTWASRNFTSYTVSYKNKYLYKQSHHMFNRPSPLSEYSPFDCVWITIRHGMSAVELLV